MSNSSTQDMDEGIYQMSLVESLLVLIVIGLWLLAVISLARKLERICNPPSIFPNYSLHTKASVCPSSRRDRHSNESVQSTLPPPITFVRATSEPAIDASPRATIYVRSPSETCLHVKSTSTLRVSAMSQYLNSPSALELGKGGMHSRVGSLTIPRTSSYHIRVETTQRPLITQTLLDPKRIPSIVRRSFLDLHRRALVSNTTTNISPIRCIVTAACNNSNANAQHTTTTTTTTNAKVPLLNKHRKANDTDEDDWCLEIYSKTEYLRGYSEEKTRNQATNLYQFLKPSQRYAIQIEQFRSQMNLDYQPPLPRPPPHASW
ncbi:unnamed protein product [Rotaria sordida]|uniref:Uncharacterized protein n=2 Tax=Rotaria sordida TaxID=392033 RepID=A0A814P737_9BILA|nr:unnamed protein product [Rotaria sordida]